jgi:putative endonuclease
LVSSRACTQFVVPRTTRKYRITRLVHVETTTDIRAAIAREKQIKAWRREKKLEFVFGAKPAWDDLVLDWRANRG